MVLEVGTEGPGPLFSSVGLDLAAAFVPSATDVLFGGATGQDVAVELRTFPEIGLAWTWLGDDSHSALSGPQVTALVALDERSAVAVGHDGTRGFVSRLSWGDHEVSSQTRLVPELLVDVSVLEEDYAMIYWDQRASGMSQGNPSPHTFTVAEFVADTDAVISVTREIYGFEQFFLLGHSRGGDLAIAYMSTARSGIGSRGSCPTAGPTTSPSPCRSPARG